MSSSRKFLFFTVMLAMIVMFSNGASAGTATDIWFTGGAINGGNNVITGTIIRPNANINGITVGLFDGMDASASCVIWNVTSSLTSGVHMVNVSVTSSGSNRSCVFDPGFQLNRGEYYFIGNGKNGVAGNQQQLNSAPSVVSGTNVNFSNASSYYLNAGVPTFYAAQFWNIRSITSSTITTLVAPSFVSPTPADGAHSSTQVNISMTCAAGLTYNLYFANSSNPLSPVLYNSTSSSWLTNATNEGLYQYKASCMNGTTGESSSNTTAKSWYYDTTFPSITLNPNNEFNMAEVTIRNAYDKQVFLNFTFADNIALFAYEFNITRAGVTYWNYTNTSLSGTSVTVTHSINATSWPEGTYNAQVLVSDAHTAHKIPDYRVENRQSKVSFKTHTGNEISIETEQGSTIRADKKDDRYQFSVDFDDKQKRDRMFHIKTDRCTLQVAQNSPYKGHLVAWCGEDGNWVDFEGAKGTPIISKVDDHHYTVYFSNLEPSVTFQSIGGLNVRAANFTFYMGNYSFNNDFSLAGETSSLTLNLTRGQNLSSTQASLSYNGALASVSKASGSSSDLYTASFTAPNTTALFNFTWTVNVSNTDSSNYSFNLNGSQNVYTFGINNCSGLGTNVTLRTYYFDEQAPSNALSASLEVTVTAWPVSRDNSFQYSTTFSPATSHALCIFPSTATLYADVYLKYTTNPGFTQRYYLVNQSFTNATRILNLYDFNDTTQTSLLKLTTRDMADYSYYKNVIVTLQRQYVGEGVWRNVQMDESGDFGLINFNILEKTTDYRLIFFDRNSERILKTTQPIKFVCTSGLCDLTYLLNENLSSTSVPSVSVNYTYVNSTKMLYVNWSDPSGLTQTVRLYVWKSSITGPASICDMTQVGNSGNFSCNCTGYQGEVYVSVRENDSLLSGWWLNLSKVSLGSLMPSKEGGLWTLLIMVTCIMFGVFSPVGAIISGIAGLIFIYLMGLFLPLTITAIIIAAVIGAVIGFKVRT